MAAAGLYMLDDNDDIGNHYVANCFPIRSFFQQRKEGAGHWLAAHRNAVTHTYRNTQTEGENYSSKSVVSECTGASDMLGCTLDANLLLSLHCVDQPSDLCSVDISEQRLNLVKTEDLLEFENVAYVNASDNCLTLEPFNKFQSLRELELSLNGLRNVTVNVEDFPHLEVLDLSYNSLSGDDILSIGLIPCLKVLHLTGNRLKTLPPNLAGHGHWPSQRAKDNGMRFQNLEVLMLDDNKLSSSVFNSLVNLKRLKHLNLQGNHISEVPDLLPRKLQEIWDHRVFEGLETQFVNAPSDVPEDLHEHVKSISEGESGQSKTYSPTHVFLETEDGEELSGAYSFSLPELIFLNLADNKIVEEEALLSVALFPVLSEIVIHSNPLTTQRSGDPPLLTSFLQERLGIKITRKKTSEFVKPRLKLKIDPKRKVKTNIPKVPKVPLPMLLNTSPSPASCGLDSLEEKHVKDPWKSWLSLKSTSTNKSGCCLQANDYENESIAAAESIKETDDAVESSNDAFQNGESFFVTQVTDLHNESEYHLLSDETEDIGENAIPEKFKGYELLLDAKPDPDMVKPVGIQHTVRMLKHTLNTLLVYRDSKPKLDSIQKPYTEKEKRIKNLPSVKLKKQRWERVEEMLIQMKERTTIREIPLTNALEDKGVCKEDYEEAFTLLRDMKKKYKMIHMQAVEQAKHIECETTTNKN
ncbi:hypothetical protein UPYG_G00117090 [Umbra pygmaea]|uniref:X-ray radiation resistance-associated protein 1 n=1 Tax=Umbra pygmaea TaxID=75934 RepID=A0ABD0X4D9_UMBPY